MNSDKVEIDILDPDTGRKYFLKVSRSVAYQVQSDDNMRHKLLQHVKNMSNGETIKMSVAMKSPSNTPGPSIKECPLKTREDSSSSQPSPVQGEKPRLPFKSISGFNFQSDADLPKSDSDEELQTYINSAKKLNTLSRIARSSYSPTQNIFVENYNLGSKENNDEQSNKYNSQKRKNIPKQTSPSNTAFKKNHSNDVCEFDVEIVDKSKDATDNKIENSGVVRWTKPMTLLLLHTYQEVKQSFNDPSSTKQKNWKKVQNIFIENGYDVTGEQCRIRMEYLKRVYKETKDHNSKSGNNRQDFQYMNEMDNLFKDEVYMSPVSTASSIRGSDSESEDECRTETAKKKKKTLKQNDLLQELLEERKKSRKQKELQMQLKADISNKMLSLLENFVKK